MPPAGSHTRLQVLRTRYPHWGAYTGIHQFLRYLDADRFAVDVRLVADGDDDFPVKTGWIRKPVRWMLRRGGMPWYKLSDLAAEVRMVRRSLRRRLDVVHYLDGEHSARYLPRLLRATRARRPKTIATYHQPAELLDSLVTRKAVRSLDAVTLVAPEQLPYFDGLLPNERVRVILHGIDVHFFQPPAERDMSDTVRCITVGHYLRDFRAIRAVAELLVGDERFRFDVVSSQARELAGIPNVETHSGLDDSELVRLYQRADVLFLPLLQSTANNALLEGIACGLPVVSTQLPSVKAYVPGAEAELVEGNDADAFVAVLQSLADNPARRAFMGRTARARAEELAWEKVAPEYARLYQELIGG